MTIDDQIRDKKNCNIMLIEKLQKYQPDHQAKLINMNILLLSSGKIDKYEYLTGGEILPSNQQQIIEQSKFTD